MCRLIVEFTDGSVNEYLCETGEEAAGQINKLQNVKGYQVVLL